MNEEFNLNDPRPLFECNQCGKRMYPVRLTDPLNDVLSCECKIAKPWKWIWTEGWAKAYHEKRQELGIEEFSNITTESNK